MNALVIIISTALLCRSYRRLLNGTHDLQITGPQPHGLQDPLSIGRLAVKDQSGKALESIGIAATHVLAVGRVAENSLPAPL